MTAKGSAQFIGGPDDGLRATNDDLLCPPMRIPGRPFFIGSPPNMIKQRAIYNFRDGNFHFTGRYEEERIEKIGSGLL